MNLASVGAVIAIVVVVVGVLIVIGVAPASPVVVGSSLAALGVARLT
jgi:hypothetical protein